MDKATMLCWGSTVNGELGLGGIEEERIFSPREVPFSETHNVQQVTCGESHTLVLTRDGRVFSCGSNDQGQLGHNKPNNRKLQLVDGLSAYVTIRLASGAYHSVAVNEWGQLFTWGDCSEGQMCLPTRKVELPTLLKSMAKNTVVQVQSGLYHNLALTNNGELYSWGCNTYGQLGIGHATPSHPPSQLLMPVKIEALAGIPIAFIACGGHHCFAVSKSGAVFGWGKNSFGQLGLNDESSRFVPTQLRMLRSLRVKYITCGDDYSVFLTKDGGVFTCGAGTYGQLGHGMQLHEMTPRKVLELMGSTVTQVACGRRHTLALVPSRGRVYAFGVSRGGQCGSNDGPQENTYIPQVVHGPWVEPRVASPAKETNQAQAGSGGAVVEMIFAGGDQSFVTVAPQKDAVPVDFRVFSDSTQILSIATDKMAELEKVGRDGTAGQETLSYLETVFASQACMNASFLLEDDAHYCCTSRHLGLELPDAEAAFRHVSRVENQAIADVILASITEEILPSLSANPPDVETLRIYVTLPLYHEFENPRHYLRLQCAFCKAYLLLQPNASTIVGKWWCSAPQEYFERLIRVFKNVLLYLVSMPKVFPYRHGLSAVEHGDGCLEATLEMLRSLQMVNHLAGLKVPYDTFYMPELREQVDVRSDYIQWLSEKTGDPLVSGVRLYLCNYAFLFDTLAKSVLLQTDQALQMCTAMSEAATRAVLEMPFEVDAEFDPTAIQYLMLNVSRDNLVSDTIFQLGKHTSRDLKRPLKVKFTGEEAEDAGGVTKEFFLLLLREVLDIKYGMFKHCEETNLIWFSENSFEDEIMFFLIGVLCGLAIYNFIIIDLPFPLALYKKLLKENVLLSDVNSLSPTLARSMQSLLDYRADDVEEVFGLTFEVSSDLFGEVKVYPLKENGGNIHVTQQNKEEFVDLYVDFIFNKSVKNHFEAFNNGFHKVCGGRVLELFHSHELMAVVVGNENYDWDQLETNTSYKNGYQPDDPTIRLFWEVFHELSLEHKKMFLMFLTGCDRVPVQGMRSIKIQIQAVSDDRFLPVAHTCFNLLDLPRYGTKEKLRYKLMQAIQQTHGFSLV